jgi:outer membrane protein TolC
MKRIFPLVTVLFSYIGLAQVSPEPLSLSQALEIGLQRNFDIRLQKKNIEVAANNNVWGEAGRWPTISLNLNQNNNLTDNVKTASPFQLQDVTIANSINPGVNLNWTLFNGFQVNINKRRLDQLQAECVYCGCQHYSGNHLGILSCRIRAAAT